MDQLGLEFLIFPAGILCIILGLVGIALPALPGIVAVWAGCLLVAWSESFQKIGILPLILVTLVMIISFGADFYAQKISNDSAETHRYTKWGAIAGSIVGLFFAPWGLFLGPFIGAVAVEYTMYRNTHKAFSAGLRALLGLLVGMFMKYVLAFTMITIVALAWLW